MPTLVITEPKGPDQKDAWKALFSMGLSHDANLVCGY